MKRSVFTTLCVLLSAVLLAQPTTWITNVTIVNTKDGKLQPLPEASRQAAADQSFSSTTAKLGQGLQDVLNGYDKTDDPHKMRVLKIWRATE